MESYVTRWIGINISTSTWRWFSEFLGLSDVGLRDPPLLMERQQRFGPAAVPSQTEHLVVAIHTKIAGAYGCPSPQIWYLNVSHRFWSYGSKIRSALGCSQLTYGRVVYSLAHDISYSPFIWKIRHSSWPSHFLDPVAGVRSLAFGLLTFGS